MAVLGTVPLGPINASVERAIADAVATIVPAGKRGALLGVVTEDGTVSFGLAAKLGPNWSLAGDVSWRWGGDVAGVVALYGCW